ncbi:MAG: efflux RND transporter periplasmic adaptor subunit [Betaproteobacteria bacterium]
MHRSVLLRLGVIAVAGLIAACDGAKAPHPAPPAPQVTVVTVKPQSVVIKTVLPGRTSPTVIAEVRPQVTGIVQSRTFSEGAEVKAGSTLYKLDPATYQTAFESARAAVAKADAAVQTARRNVERNKELVAIKFVSQQAYDDAVTTLHQNEADLAAAQAAAAAARINLAYTSVVAPISGRAGKSAVTAGALVTANQAAPLVTIQQMNPMYVDVTQSSSEVLRLRRAMASGELKRARADAARVTLLLEDGTPYAQDGTLQFSDVTVDASTGAITLRALFPNPDGVLLPNMYVRAVIEEGVRDNAILVPQQAVTRDPKGQAIAMVVGANNTVEARILTTARTLGSDWLVDAGLKPGDRVIVEGLLRARPGATVQAVEAAPAAPASPAPASPAAAPSPAPVAPAQSPQSPAPSSAKSAGR